MFSKGARSYLLAILLIPMSTVGGQDKHSFSLPDSILLFGTYNELRVVTPERVLEINPPVEVGSNHGYFLYPGLSPRGDLVAWGFAVAFEKDRPRNTVRFTLGVYSIKDQKWKTYGDFDNVGSPAFSPDGSKIAFLALDAINGPRLRIFDVLTEKMTAVTNENVEDVRGKGGIPYKATIGWSPDGKRIVVELERTEKSSLIAVVDLSTGEVKPIAEGHRPAWSPTGEWIAYIDVSPDKCMLVHPDGTGAKMVSKVKSTFFTDKSYNHAVVWSPDAKKLLLNEYRGPYGATDVVLLDLETGRAIKKSENGLRAFGWVARGK